ncbi:SufE family protein [Afifella pfennigii]|uniref:SufE family protein n=1 Tax=Afifella pfennigii TaxID=209897 RepID=UPI0004792FE0|nr:SufE family protein [Afifella pfennigii]
MSIQDIIDDFALLDDWEDRYRYVIELGRALPEMAEEERSEANKVRGCASQVWLISENDRRDDKKVLVFRGDSDAHIVRGLIAILLQLYSGHTPAEIVSIDAEEIFQEMGLREHLTAQRSNGLSAMLARIRRDAEQRLAA